MADRQSSFKVPPSIPDGLDDESLARPCSPEYPWASEISGRYVANLEQVQNFGDTG